MGYRFKVDGTNRLGMRASLITLGNVRTEFPQRIETSTDRFYMDKLPNGFEIKNPSSDIYMVKRAYKEDDLKKLVVSTGFFTSEKEKIKQIREKRPEAVSVLNVSIGRNTNITEIMNKKLISLQYGFKALRIYDSIFLTPEELRTRIRESLKYASDYGIDEQAEATSVVIHPLQKPDLLREKLHIILDETDGSSTKYISPYNAVRQYEVYKDVIDQYEKWNDLFDVPKTWRGNGRTSMMHLMAHYGFDTLSLLTGRVKKKIKYTLKRFDDVSLGYLMPAEHKQRYGNDLLCGCEVDNGFTLPDLTDGYSPQELNGIFRSHEAYASNMEFAFDRPLIIESGNALLDRYRAKEFAKQPFNDLFHIDFRNKHL